jgi:hypothetical protein
MVSLTLDAKCAYGGRHMSHVVCQSTRELTSAA